VMVFEGKKAKGMTMRYDNQGAVAQVCNQIGHQRACHIHVSHHIHSFGKVLSGEIKVEDCPN
jgi:hypothetical protein